MKKLYIRLQPKKDTERFFRCGIEFRRTWLAVEVDAATATRLEAEQMLEVSETNPEEPAHETPNETDLSGNSTTGTDSDTPADAPGVEAAGRADPAAAVMDTSAPAKPKKGGK